MLMFLTLATLPAPTLAAATEPASLVPEFFRPDLAEFPSRRAALFESVVGNSPEISDRLAALARLLRKSRGALTVALGRERLLSPETGEISDLKFYTPLFSRFPDDLWPALLDATLALNADAALALLLKAVAVAGAGPERFSEISGSLCPQVRAMRWTLRTPQPRWRDACAGAGSVGIFRELTPQELYFVVKVATGGDFSGNLWKILAQGTRASADLLAQARQVPAAVDPLGALLCQGRELQLEYFCTRLLERQRDGDWTPAELQRMQEVQRTLETSEEGSEIAEISDTWLTLPVDYKARRLMLLRAVIWGERHEPRWPLLGRLVREAETEEELQAEVAFLVGGGARKFMDAVEQVCFDYMQTSWRCLDFLRNFQVSLPTGAVQAMVNQPERLLEVATLFVFSSDKKFPIVTSGLAVRKDKRGEDCGVCLQKFSDKREALELCAAAGDVQAHLMCRPCAELWFGDVNNPADRTSCPLCTRPVRALAAGSRRAKRAEAFLKGETQNWFVRNYAWRFIAVFVSVGFMYIYLVAVALSIPDALFLMRVLYPDYRISFCCVPNFPNVSSLRRRDETFGLRSGFAISVIFANKYST